METPETAQIERELLRRAREGDSLAFREIIGKHEGRVASTVIGILGAGPEVDDIGQETFIRFFQALDRFREDASLATYLTRIAINLSINELRRRKRVRCSSPDNLAEGPNAGCACRERIRSGDAQAVIRQALERLEPRFRTIIVLRLVNGYSVRETASILRLPLGTVLSRLARGQEKLKRIVAELGDSNGNGRR